jgi:hypothetical protein
MALYVRQTGNKPTADNPYPYPDTAIQNLKRLLLPRVALVDPAELENFKQIFDKRASEWKRYECTAWDKKAKDTSFLLSRAGSYVDGVDKLTSWSTPMSMRNVDAECEAHITKLYILERNGEGHE